MWVRYRPYLVPAVAVLGGAALALLLIYFFAVRRTVPPRQVTTKVTTETKETKAVPPVTTQKETKKETVVTTAPAAKAPAAEAVKTPPPSPPACTSRSYTVVRGDSLWRIAGRQWGGRSYFWPVLAEVNHLRNPNLILIGQVLTIPCLDNLPPLPAKPSVKVTRKAPPASLRLGLSLGPVPGAYSGASAVQAAGNRSLQPPFSERGIPSVLGHMDKPGQPKWARPELFFDFPT